MLVKVHDPTTTVTARVPGVTRALAELAARERRTSLSGFVAEAIRSAALEELAGDRRSREEEPDD